MSVRRDEYDGSSKHYQAVPIIRNKTKASADMVLSLFNAVLNIIAIIANMDFPFSDKRLIFLIQQELSTLRQCKKLTLLLNKTNMSYESAVANSMNEKYRMDALRVK